MKFAKGRGNIGGEWRPIVKYKGTLRWAVPNDCTDQDAVWVKTRMSHCPMNHLLEGVEVLHRNGHFLGVSVP